MAHPWHDIPVDGPVEEGFPALIELRRFFEDYKILENKRVRVADFDGPARAHEVVRAGLAGYGRLRGARP